jgi:hypothetical protein
MASIFKSPVFAYINEERERERELGGIHLSKIYVHIKLHDVPFSKVLFVCRYVSVCLCVCVFVYVYMYI